MKFKELLSKAKAGDEEAIEELFLMYRPMMLKLSKLKGRFSEDLYQELSIYFLKCIDKFDIDVLEKKSK